MTSDPEVLKAVTGQYIEFDILLMRVKPLIQARLSELETESVDLEITQLPEKGVIQPSHHETGEFISLSCFYLAQEGWLLRNDFKPEVI